MTPRTVIINKIRNILIVQADSFQRTECFYEESTIEFIGGSGMFWFRNNSKQTSFNFLIIGLCFKTNSYTHYCFESIQTKNYIGFKWFYLLSGKLLDME